MVEDHRFGIESDKLLMEACIPFAGLQIENRNSSSSEASVRSRQIERVRVFGNVDRKIFFVVCKRCSPAAAPSVVNRRDELLLKGVEIHFPDVSAFEIIQIIGSDAYRGIIAKIQILQGPLLGIVKIFRSGYVIVLNYKALVIRRPEVCRVVFADELMIASVYIIIFSSGCRVYYLVLFNLSRLDIIQSLKSHFGCVL